MHWDPSTGEGTPIAKEFANMSRMPGIGSTWLEKYFDDVYPRDYVVINNTQIKPPRFYDKILEKKDPLILPPNFENLPSPDERIVKKILIYPKLHFR